MMNKKKSLNAFAHLSACVFLLTSCNKEPVIGPQGIQGIPGENGHSPLVTIGENGNWFLDGVDTGVKAQGPKGDDGLTPYICNNGNWWIGESAY